MFASISDTKVTRISYGDYVSYFPYGNSVSYFPLYWFVILSSSTGCQPLNQRKWSGTSVRSLLLFGWSDILRIQVFWCAVCRWENKSIYLSKIFERRIHGCRWKLLSSLGNFDRGSQHSRQWRKPVHTTSHIWWNDKNISLTIHGHFHV